MNDAVLRADAPEMATEVATPSAYQSQIANRKSQIRSLFASPIFLLLLITLLGAFLRLVSLDQPALWGDEAFTFSRVCGTYRQMLDILQANGFMPLHYSLYWWVGQHWDLSPVVMRLPVAIPGMLMPPAMYFLAKQMRLATSTALVTALFTACSAYMLAYSRDAKMYMPFWLAVATHVGCLLWWLNGHERFCAARSGERIDPADCAVTPPRTFRFLCFLASGVAMVGIHALGGAILGIDAAIFLSMLIVRPKVHWKTAIPFVLSTAAIGCVVWLYFAKFTAWDENAAEEWNLSGLNWIPFYNSERDGGDLLLFTASAFAFSWEWPNPGKQPAVDPRALKLLMAATVIFGALAVIGLLPWRTPARRIGRVNDGSVRTWPAHVIWIGLWLALPAYGWYCRSMQPFVSPWRLAIDLYHASRPYAWWLLVPAVIAAIFSFWRTETTIRRRLIAVGWFVFVVAVIFGGMCATYFVVQGMYESAKASGRVWRNIWMPRYVGFLWPAFAIALCVLLMRLPTRGFRVAAIALLVFTNLMQFSFRVWGGSEPPTDRFTADLAAAQPVYVRQQQIGMDVSRQTLNLLTGGTVRLWRLEDQLKKTPLPANEPEVRVYVQTGTPSPEPAGGTVSSYPHRYYLAWRLGVETFPAEFRRTRVDRQWTFPIGLAPRSIASEMEKKPHIKRLVTWDRTDGSGRDPNRNDPLLAALGPTWKAVSEEVFPARDHWTWRLMYQLRRREYVRIAPPQPKPPPVSAATTAPSTRVASRPPTVPTTRPEGVPSTRSSGASATVPSLAPTTQPPTTRASTPRPTSGPSSRPAG